MAWVAVDKDGREKISNSPLVRIKDITTNRRVLLRFTKNDRSKWIDSWWSDNLQPYSFEGVTLPKGSIKKLIGKPLTWEDEPVEI